MFTIENAKEYLKAVVTVLNGMSDPTGMNAKTCECITLLLEHCEALEVHIEVNKPGLVKLMEDMEAKEKQ
jgi:polynucleotide 5'-kinase involved in rRNA processing